jgi:hypothetical protein
MDPDKTPEAAGVVSLAYKVSICVTGSSQLNRAVSSAHPETNFA